MSHMPPFEQKALREALAFAEAMRSRSAEKIFATQDTFLKAMEAYRMARDLELEIGVSGGRQ